METREPVGFVTATVRFPLYEGDRKDGSWDDFIYREPGIDDRGNLRSCVRKCETMSSKIDLVKSEAA